MTYFFLHKQHYLLVAIPKVLLILLLLCRIKHLSPQEQQLLVYLLFHLLQLRLQILSLFCVDLVWLVQFHFIQTLLALGPMQLLLLPEAWQQTLGKYSVLVQLPVVLMTQVSLLSHWLDYRKIFLLLLKFVQLVIKLFYSGISHFDIFLQTVVLLL